MANLSEIGAARAAVLDYIEAQDCSIHLAIKYLNQRHATGTLPDQLKGGIFEHAWRNPRECKFTPSTLYKWRQNRRRRGHDCPLLTRQKDMTVKPWHLPAWLLKERNPEMTIKAILAKISEKYPAVGYYRLRRFLNFMKVEAAQS